MQITHVLSGFKAEKNEKVWSKLTAILGALSRMIKLSMGEETIVAFTSFAASLVRPAFKTVGWDITETDDDNKKLLRQVLVGGISKFCAGDADVVAAVQTRFK